MAAEIQVNVNLKGEQAKATVDSIEKAKFCANSVV